MAGIATPIDTSNPYLWYTLDNGTVNDETAGARHGSLTGDAAHDTVGVEVGLGSVHLNPTGGVASPALGLSGHIDLSIGLYVSVQPQATFAASTIMSFGNPGLRGPGIDVAWTGGALFVRGRGFPQSTNIGSVNPSTPHSYWHWICLTYTAASRTGVLYIDAGAGVSGTLAANMTGPLSTDIMQLIAPLQLQVAHAVVWNRVISGAESAAIGAFGSQWPWIHGLDPTGEGTGGGGGGGGGLTAEEHTWLSDIDVKTDDIPGLVEAATYISDTVNTINGKIDELETAVGNVSGKVDEALGHLNTLLETTAEQVLPALDAIKDAVTRIFITSAGLGLGTPIGSLLAHPDPNLLHAAAETFVISGQGTLTPPGPLGYGNVYGIRWDATVIPPGVGFRDGIITSYTQRLVQWVLWYPDVGDLELHPQEVAEFRLRNYTWLWSRPFPNTIQYDVLPGFELTCKFILLAPITPP